jgi:hypothetical protein
LDHVEGVELFRAVLGVGCGRKTTFPSELKKKFRETDMWVRLQV